MDWYAKVWQTLEGDKRNGVHPEALVVFTAAIMKILLSPPDIAGSKYGTLTEDGKLTVNQQQATRIHKDFILLYLNRTAYGGPGNKVVEGADVSEYTFKPSLCELSVSIVNSTRVKQTASKDLAADPSKANQEHVEQLIQNKEKKEA